MGLTPSVYIMGRCIYLAMKARGLISRPKLCLDCHRDISNTNDPTAKPSEPSTAMGQEELSEQALGENLNIAMESVGFSPIKYVKQRYKKGYMKPKRVLLTRLDLNCALLWM